jgi:HEPN domain-containing protein
MNKNELENLADIRIKEAEVLLKAKCYHGAYYLAGYALECTLKACIAKQIKEFDFPVRKLTNDSYTHDLNKLLLTAGLKQQLDEQEKLNKDFKLNWAVALMWSEESRYEYGIGEQDAQSIFNAISDSISGV